MVSITNPVKTAVCMICAATGLLSAALSAQDSAHIWIEGEAPASANVKPNTSGWGRKEFLSGEAWLSYSIDADKVKNTVPAEGIILKYNAVAKTAGEYEVWARIGYEFVRSPFEWRIGNNAWQRVEPATLTTDLMELATWCEVAWLQLGKQKLDAGTHSLELRLTAENDDKGKPKRILFACDALCLSPTPFAPNGRFKPGEDWRTDKDRAAAVHVFKFPGATAPGARASIPLNGMWEVCRADEQLPPADIAQPMKDLPANLHWTAIDVPSDKNKSRPDLLFAHRLWYRARVDIPANLAGRAFILRFPQNNLNTTVFVNGTYCGFFKYPFADFSIDVTPGLKPGANEIWVGIRDAWYGYSTNPNDPMKLRRKFNLPLDSFGKGFQDLAYPIWHHAQSGILQTPELIVAGAEVYTSDVFVKPSVAKKTLAADVTLKNTTKQNAAGKINWEAVNTKTGAIEKKFTAASFSLAAGEEKTFPLAEAWADPKLWWPDEPNLYNLRVTVMSDSASKVGGASSSPATDVSETRFGFREWDWSTKDFKLNGIVWHGWADCFTAGTKEDWLKFYKEKNQTVMRLWATSWKGMAPREALNFYDENGVVCRRSGIFDGEMIGYNAMENDPDLKKESPIKMDLFRNWAGQMAAQVRGERNHPSVMLWSIENEILFINCINLYRNHMDAFEAEITKAAEEVMRVDPTRPVMVDGGGATKAQTLPVHGDHYVAGKPADYPPLAYQTNPTGGGRGRWVWDEKRPRFLGEDFFMTGSHPEVAAFQGDSAFAGKPVRGVGIWNRILQEGYRWAGYGAWHYWLGQNDTDSSQYTAYAARAVFSRDWNWTFAPGANVKRTFGVFNDTRHADPITFTWALMVNGKKAAGRSQTLNVVPGTRATVAETLAMPRTKGRTEAELILTLTVGGKEVFRDTKAVTLLEPQNRASLPAADLVVLDPGGTLAPFLKSRGIAFTPATTLDALPQNWKVLVVGPDALDERESATSRLAALAAAGRRVILLDQDHPLRYQGLPAEMEPAQNKGYTAFLEDPGHPLLAGLDSKDFFTWADDAPVYRNAYEKPTRGGRSLIQCHDMLRHSALAEIPVGTGLLLPCQLTIASQLADNPAAQQLLLNLLGHAAAYRLEHHPVTACLAGAPDLKAALDQTGLKYTEAADPVKALAQKTPSILIVNASPANLANLAANLPTLQTFTTSGGSLILCGLTPDGLNAYNRIVGVDHMIRPFGRERITLPALRSRLTAGLTAADVTLFSSERIFPWTAGNYVASDVFSHVIDYDEVAPFGKSTFGSYGQIINGFVSADAWKLIINFPKNADDSPYPVPITFPKEQTFTEFTWIGNTLYYPQTKLNLIFDGDRGNMLTLATAPNAEPHTFAIDPPRRAKSITLELAEWETIPGKAANLGIDNIYFKIQRPTNFHDTVKPFTNIGGLMEYQTGKGRIVLCNLLFKASEDVPENAAKKRRILATLLQNLKAPFDGGRTLVAGMNLKYQPLDISKSSTQYRDDKGWFGDKARTFKDLPTGSQRLAGVPFDIFDMATSPVPNALMLAGKNIPGNLPKQITGIPVNTKADALFFLHAARVDKRRSDADKKKGTTYELAKYIVHYADGQKIEIPVIAEIDVENYVQKSPAVIPGAQLAWTKPYATGDASAAYMKQWSNPRPGVEIKSIDLLPGKNSAGTPVLLALTVARSE